MPSWARRCGGSVVTSWPSTIMRPPVGGSAPAMALNSVVLPAPLGPIMARRWPRGTVRLTPSTARKASNATTTSESVQIGSDTTIAGRWNAAPAAPPRWRAQGSLMPSGSSLLDTSGSSLLDALEGSRIRRLLHVSLGVVSPELRNVRIARHRHVPVLAVGPLDDLADLDVVDRVAVTIELDGFAQRRTCELRLQHRIDQEIAVLDLAAHLFQS